MEEQNPTFIDSTKLIFGIGQVEKITEVSGRQLRYWEKQGYIQPLEQKKGASRQYNLHTLFMIFHIQRFLNQGFTLQTAVDKARKFDEQIPVLREFLSNQLKGIIGRDDQKLLDFGYLDASHQQRIYGVIKDGKTSFKIDPVSH